MDRLEMNGAEGTAQCSQDRLKPVSNLPPPPAVGTSEKVVEI
jgi:hypothetical protein